MRGVIRRKVREWLVIYKRKENGMRMKLTVAAAMMLAVPLVAENVNGFENFKLSRNDFKSNPSSVLADFSSRTRTEDSTFLTFGTVITIR